MTFANKKIFKNGKGDIHVGNNSPDGFSEATINDIDKALKNIAGKTLWRCTVCNDLCIINEPPKICPTCFQEEVYAEINEKEFRNFLEL